MPAVTAPLMSALLVWLNAFAMAFVPVVAAIIAHRALNYLAQRNINACWFEAISRAGGEAYKAFLLTGKPLTDLAALQAASLAGAAYLSARVPALVLARGLDPAALAQIAGAELGKLLALDPAVKPGEAAAVLAPVAVVVPVVVAALAIGPTDGLTAP